MELAVFSVGGATTTMIGDPIVSSSFPPLSAAFTEPNLQQTTTRLGRRARKRFGCGNGGGDETAEDETVARGIVGEVVTLNMDLDEVIIYGDKLLYYVVASFLAK